MRAGHDFLVFFTGKGCDKPANRTTSADSPPRIARSPCFSLYIYARFRLRTNSIHHLKTLDYGRTTGQQPAVDGHPARHGRERHAQAVSGVKDGELQTKNPFGGQQRPPAGGSPRRYVFEFLFQPLEPVERPDPLPLLPCAGRGGAAGSRRFPATGEPVRQDGRAARCAVRGAAARAGAAADPSRAAATAGGCAAAVRRADRTEPAVQSTARRTSTGTASPPSACSGSRSRATGCSTRCYGASRLTRPSGCISTSTASRTATTASSLKPGTDGRLTVCSHGILDPEKMQKQFFGYDITDSDKQVLRQTGNMGHPATVTNRAGEQVEALVSRNLKTNELVAFPLSKVNIPAEKNGHTFTPDEIARLKQGEAVVCQFLSRAKEGGAAQTLPGSRAVQRSQDADRISFSATGAGWRWMRTRRT